ncbi:MAG: asparagine synthase (glutamine-hydrolyzing), partial [Candidatus Brocadiia bacterium]
NVSLGNCRLAILDLTPHGHQPMSNEDGSLWIVHNGEIYNFEELRTELIQLGHTFISRTDTEVVLHAYEQWGIESFEKFHGMWGFCLYDKKAGELILSRDPFGIKPVYYYHHDDRFIFSSMISGILVHKIDTRPNDTAVMEFLAYNLKGHTNNTFFENISIVPAGHYIRYDLKTGKPAVVKWYTPRIHENVSVQDIRQAFFNSVKYRTVADVPIGSCLSGGIDSTAIVCTLDKQLDYPFSTFSFSAPGYKIDETKYIKEVGKHTKTKQFFTEITDEEFLDEIYDLVKTLEEPILGPSLYAQYRVMKLAHQHGAKVLLDGQGGDEIFGGYTYYFAYRFYGLLRRCRLITLCREMFLCAKNFKSFLPFGLFTFILMPNRLKNAIFKLFVRRWINHSLLVKLCGERSDPRWQKLSLKEALRLTLFSTSIPHLLLWEDKNSMRWSVESRVPFLDTKLVEMALSLQPEQKLKNGKTKLIFKQAIKDILPEMILARKDKIGFTVPVNDLFRSPKIIDFCKKIIYSDSFKSRPYWKWDRICRMFNAHIAGRKNHGKELW